LPNNPEALFPEHIWSGEYSHQKKPKDRSAARLRELSAFC
jgi:hypothetical protein